MLLKALKDIPTSVNMIPRGDQFIEQDEVRALDWISQGYAEQIIAPPKKVESPTALPENVVAAMSSKPSFPLSWRNCTAVIVASGPSLTEEQCEAVRVWHAANALARVVAINTSFRRAPFADILYACDGQWWKQVDPKTGLNYFTEASEYFPPESMWTQDSTAARDFSLQHIRSIPGSRLSLEKTIICQGMTSTIQAMNIAFHAGASRFILLGVDCKGRHWHEEHPPPLARSLPHRAWQENFAIFGADLKDQGIEVVNCSPGTALNAFRKGELAEELAK